MFNPWVILAAVIFWGASVTGAFIKGEGTQHTKEVAAAKDQQDQAVQQAKDEAAIDYGVAQTLALEQQKRELLRATNSGKVAKVLATDKAAVNCRLGDDSFSVLRNSLSAANGAASSPASASDGAVPAGSDTGRPVTGSGDVRTGQHVVDPLDVQSGASTAN